MLFMKMTFCWQWINLLVCPCTLQALTREDFSPGSSSLFRAAGIIHQGTLGSPPGQGHLRVGSSGEKSLILWRTLIRQRASGRLKREYLAVVEGSMLHDEGTIALPIGRVEGSGIRRGYVPTGKPARTQYEVIRRGRNWSLVRLTLATGRTHQIRVHMEAIGHPLVGDAVYGRPAQDCPRQALHAWRLSFVHPRTGRT